VREASVKPWLAPIAASLLLLGGSARAGTSERAEIGRARTPTKVSADLARLYAAHASGRGSGHEPVDPSLRVVGDHVLVDAVAAGDVNVLKADLEALGMQDAVAFGRIVSGRFPVRAIGALDGLASLKFARPAAATTHPGGARGGAR
jgi:hypothetical protein